jgi:hypothetical protein
MQNIELIFIALGTLLLVVAALLGRRQEPAPASPPPPEALRPDVTPESIVELQAYLIELLRDLHELSNNMTADLDDRLTELKDVLEEADNKLEGVSATRTRKEGVPEPEPEAASEISEPEATSPGPPERPARPEEPKPEQPEPEERAESRAVSSAPTGRYREIYQMDDQGAPIDEIARHMKMGKGEIQLILSLREKN